MGAHLWKHCTTVARKKLEMMAAMETATPEKMMINRSVSDRLNLHSLKLASDSSCRATLRLSVGREHWIRSRPWSLLGESTPVAFQQVSLSSAELKNCLFVHATRHPTELPGQWCQKTG